MHRALIPLLFILAAPLSAPAEPVSLLAPAVFGGSARAELRGRYEHVSTDTALQDATALTARLKLDYQSSKWNRLDFGLEALYTAAAAAEEYNSLRNQRSQFAAIADPNGGALSAAWLRWQAPYAFTMTAGKQALDFERSRYLGSDAFRQRPQRFTAVTVVNDYLPNTEVEATWLNAAHPVTGGNLRLDGHVLRVRYQLRPALEIGGYAYHFDFNAPARDDTRTYGLRAEGAYMLPATRPGPVVQGLQMSYQLEAAHQSADAQTNGRGRALHGLAQLGLRAEQAGAWQRVEAYGRLEALGGDGGYAFQTPLASLHEFQGPSDQFLATPADGLLDIELGARATLDSRIGTTSLAGEWHRYEGIEESIVYGYEWALSAEQTMNRYLMLGASYAHYRAEALGADSDKVWLYSRLRLGQ
jgi:hypothetical protein